MVPIEQIRMYNMPEPWHLKRSELSIFFFLPLVKAPVICPEFGYITVPGIHMETHEFDDIIIFHIWTYVRVPFIGTPGPK